MDFRRYVTVLLQTLSAIFSRLVILTRAIAGHFQSLGARSLAWWRSAPLALRLVLTILLLFTTITSGLIIVPQVLRQQPNAGTPHYAGPNDGSNSTTHLPPPPSAQGWTAPEKPGTIIRAGTGPKVLGSVKLSATAATSFTTSDGSMDVTIPAGAITQAEVAAAGGAVQIQLTQVAPATGGNAGGMGSVSFGSYLLELQDAKGNGYLRGLHLAPIATLHYGAKNSAIDLSQAFTILNGALPQSFNAAFPAKQVTLGPLSHGAVRHDMAAHTLQTDLTPLVPGQAGAATTSVGAAPLRQQVGSSSASAAQALALSTPSTTLTWMSPGSVPVFNRPAIRLDGLPTGGLQDEISPDIPPAPGYTLPDLGIRYDSNLLNEQSDPRGAAEWVGEGRTLGLGYIQWAEHNVTVGGTPSTTWQSQWLLSDPYGTTAELIPPNLGISTYYDDTPNSPATNPVTWRSSPDTYAKIVTINAPFGIGMPKTPPCWRVWLKSGVMQEYGCTQDSMAYYYVPGMGHYVYKWFLDLITTPEGNQIHITYNRDIVSTTYLGTTYYFARDTVPATIEWDDPNCRNSNTSCGTWAPRAKVVFNSAHTVTRLTNTPTGCNTDSTVRCDNPPDYAGGLPAPRVQSTFVLNDIQVQTRALATDGWTTLRTYQLSYEQSGYSSRQDPATGKMVNIPGYLDLTKVQVVGKDGTSTLPATTFTYGSYDRHYVDSTFKPNPSTNCGPSWNVGTGQGCFLWNQTTPANNRYLTQVRNGYGEQVDYVWAEARNNTHGVPTGNSPADPFYCNTHQTTSPCPTTDDQDWSRIALQSETRSVKRVSQAGQGGQQTTTTVAGTTTYSYQLTYPLPAQFCGDCVSGMYWGDQNSANYLEYYNAFFMGFAQVGVSHPDGSLDVHKYYSTMGWGVYNTAKVGCASTLPPVAPCHNAPWWDVRNAAHGRELEASYYDTNGTTLLKKITHAYQAVCPPPGVAATPPKTGYGDWDLNNVSTLGLTNKVAACDVRMTQEDDFTLDGANETGAPHVTTVLNYDTWGRVSQRISSNGNGLKADYYDNQDLTALKLTRNDRTVKFDWGTSSPDPVNIASTTYSARWTGYVRAPYSGTYTFYTTSDDGVRLWVNNSQLVNNWTDHAPTENSGTIALTAGQLYPVTLEYYQNGGGASISLSWSHASISKQIVPVTALFTRVNGNGSPDQRTTNYEYIQNNAITATQTSATGIYIIDVKAHEVVTDAGGVTQYACTETAYDGGSYAVGQQSSLVAGNATGTTSFADCNAHTGGTQQTVAYDAYGNLNAVRDPNANAGDTSHTTSSCAVLGVNYTSCASVDTNRQAVPTQQTSVGATGSATFTTSTTYNDGAGLWPTSTQDINAQSTSAAYDPFGRAIKVTAPGETASDGQTMGRVYTSWCAGNGPEIPCVEIDTIQRLDDTTTVTNRAFYDGENRQIETRSPAPGGQDVVQYVVYDTNGKAITKSVPYFVPAYTGNPGVNAFSIPDTSQAVTTSTYDGLGRTLTTSDPLTQVTTTAYIVDCGYVSGDGNCYERTVTTDAKSHRTMSLLDGLARIIYSQQYTGANPYALYRTEKSVYDVVGHVVTSLLPDGSHQATYTYNHLGRITASSDPDLGTYTYTYDANGNLQSVADPRGASGTVRFCYDANNRLTTVYTSGSCASPSGVLTTYSYDSGGNGKARLSGETFTSNGVSGSYSYTYDARGRRSGWTMTLGTNTYGFTFGYNDADMPTSVVYPDGDTVSLAYGSQGWLAQAIETLSSVSNTLVSAISYGNQAGALKLPSSASVGNSAYQWTMGYDLLGRQTSTAVNRASDSALLFSQSRAFDAVSNVTSVNTALFAGTDNQAYCYDDLNRLSWAGSTGTAPCGQALTTGTLTSAQYQQSYNFDVLDRLTSGPLGSGYQYQDAAHLNAVTSVGTAYTATYDAAGDMICRAPSSSQTCAGGTPTGQTLSYDVLRRLTTWASDSTGSPSSSAVYAYDGSGQRVYQSVTSGGTTTNTTYVGGYMEVSVTGSTTSTTKYYSAGVASVVNKDGVLSYLVSDGLSSTSEALDAAGNVMFEQLYEPFGSVRYTSGAAPTAKGFTGQRSDPSGLAYYNARYYDPTVGQFTSADSVPDGWNRFGYVHGNPTTYTDPSGHIIDCAFNLIGEVSGGRSLGSASASAAGCLGTRGYGGLTQLGYNIPNNTKIFNSLLNLKNNDKNRLLSNKGGQFVKNTYNPTSWKSWVGRINARLNPWSDVHDTVAVAQKILDPKNKLINHDFQDGPSKIKAARQLEDVAETVAKNGKGIGKWIGVGGKVVGVAGVVVTFAASVKDDYDQHGDGVRAAVVGTVHAVLSTGGAYLGGAAGAAIGEVVCFGFPACGVAGAFIGSWAGAWAGDQVATKLIDAWDGGTGKTVTDTFKSASAALSTVFHWP
jgi:RHS repeat-associated protein